LHASGGDWPARPGCRVRGATDKWKIADPLELFVVGYTGRAIAKADFCPDIQVDFGAAIRRLATEGFAASQLPSFARPQCADMNARAAAISGLTGSAPSVSATTLP
jgi:hypothetical protein